MFQDVGLQNASFKPLTHISFSCEVPTPSDFEGQTPHSETPHP